MEGDEHSLHTGGVTGSIPVAPTISQPVSADQDAPARSTEQERAPIAGGNLGEPVHGSSNLDILTASVAMVIQLLASGQIPRERVPSLLAERPDVAEAWSSEQRGGGASGWQPIETAPRDGTEVLAWHPGLAMGAMVLSFWDGGWREKANCMRLKTEPSNWMPLPAPPRHPHPGSRR